MRQVTILLLCLALLLPLMGAAFAEVAVFLISEDGTETIVSGLQDDTPGGTQDGAEGSIASSDSTSPPALNSESSAARDAFIDGIIALAKKKHDDANGRAQRAQYSGDIYVCKNFTVYLFRENRDRFRMAEHPDVPLVIPDNQKKDDCLPYVYGVEWKDIPAGQGNPFYAAATFRYDETLSALENRNNARAFLQQVQRGDYFQMAAKYYYGTGAHSMIFIEDYNEATDSVHWTDSNMRGEKRNGERYGYVQFDAVKEIDWFVDAFCRKSYGATIYRLRDDIVFVGSNMP